MLNKSKLERVVAKMKEQDMPQLASSICSTSGLFLVRECSHYTSM